MMHLRWNGLAALAVIALAAFAPGCAAQSSTAEAPTVVRDAGYASAIDRARGLLEERLREGAPGFSIAVAIGGETVWAEGLGLADLESGTPVTTHTRFRIGSTSKSITSAVAGRLLEAGVVDLDADVRDLLPQFPEKRWPFSLYDLLTNQAGIRHYRGLEPLNQRHYESVLAGLSILSADTLLFEPHSFVSYSSYGFNIAGAAMAAAVGTSFEEVAEREVFAPLGMTASGIDDPTIEIPNRATFYSGGPDGPRLAPAVDDSYKAPSGGLLSTPSDLVKFGSALLSGVTQGGTPWLRAATIERMFTPRPIADGRNGGYAMGFRIQTADTSTDPAVPYAVHHGGSSIGGRSMLYLLPDDGVVVSLLCNYDGYDTKEDDTAAIADFFLEVMGR